MQFKGWFEIMCLLKNDRTENQKKFIEYGNAPLILRTSAHGTHRHIRGMKIVVITTLVHLDVLMVGIVTAGIRRQKHTLMPVTASAIDLAVGTAPETVPTPEDAPDPAPLRCVVVMTVAE